MQVGGSGEEGGCERRSVVIVNMQINNQGGGPFRGRVGGSGRRGGGGGGGGGSGWGWAEWM